MWRVVNFRCFLFTALCCIATTLICVFFSHSWAVFALAVFFIAVLSIAILLAISRDAVKSISLFLCAVCVIAVGTRILIERNETKAQLDSDVRYEFAARVDSVKNNESYVTLLLDDVKANGKAVKGKISLKVHLENNAVLSVVQAGDYTAFASTVNFYSVYENPAGGGYAYRNGIRYYADIEESTLRLTGYEPTFLQRLRNKIFNVLDDNLDGYGALAFGMITGETGEIESEVRSYYSISGLGHILAVSGLHVGFVMLILTFICKKLRVNKWVALAITTASLLFYCFLAGFSVSVIRASVMSLIGILASVLGKRNDPLSSLSLAVTVILLAAPLYIFDAGFLLSVSAVLGLILFATSIERAFRRALPRFIARPLATSIAAQIGIAPVMIAFFDTIPTYSIFSNLLVIPLITIAFIAVSVALVFALLIPPAGIIVSIAGIGISLVDTIAQFVALLPLAELRIFSFSGIIFFLALYFICSRYFMLPRFKWLVTISASLIVVISLVVCNVPVNKKYDFLSTAAYKDVTVLLRTNDGVAIVGDCTDYNAMDNLLTIARERSVDRVYLTKFTADTAIVLDRLSDRYKIKAVYCPSSVDFSGLSSFSSSGVPFYLFYEDDDIPIVDAVYTDGFVAYKYVEGDAAMLILGYGAKLNDVPIDVINSCAIIRSYVFDGTYEKRMYLVNYENSYVENKPERQAVLREKIYSIDVSSGLYKIYK